MVAKITHDEIDVVKRIATIYAAGQPGRFDKAELTAQATVRMLHGMTVGLSPTAGLQAYEFAAFGGDNGMKSLNTTPDEALRLVEMHPDYEWRPGARYDQEQCDLQFRRRSQDGDWEEWREFTLTRQQAEQRNLTANKSQWQKYPAQMLRAKAVAHGVRMHCAGVHGISTDDMPIVEEQDDGSFEVSNDAPQPATRMAPDRIPPGGIPGQRWSDAEVERDWATGEPLTDAPVVDEETGEVVRPATDANPAQPTAAEKHALVMQRISDPDFVIRRINGVMDIEVLSKMIAAIAEHQGLPSPSIEYIKSVQQMTNEDAKGELQTFALGADA